MHSRRGFGEAILSAMVIPFIIFVLVAAAWSATDTSPPRISLPSLPTFKFGGEKISGIFTDEVQYWSDDIERWASQVGVSPNAAATIMQLESCGDPLAGSSAGAAGLFQVMPYHFEDGENPLDPDTNAMRGLAFFKRQLEYTGNDIYLAFAGYNGGYAASGSYYDVWPNETQQYYTWAKAIYDDAEDGVKNSPAMEAWLATPAASYCQVAASRLASS